MAHCPRGGCFFPDMIRSSVHCVLHIASVLPPPRSAKTVGSPLLLARVPRLPSMSPCYTWQSNRTNRSSGSHFPRYSTYCLPQLFGSSFVSGSCTPNINIWLTWSHSPSLVTRAWVHKL